MGSNPKWLPLRTKKASSQVAGLRFELRTFRLHPPSARRGVSSPNLASLARESEEGRLGELW